MSNYGLIASAVFYFVSGAQLAWNGNYAMAVAMFCWSFGNVALNMAVSK